MMQGAAKAQSSSGFETSQDFEEYSEVDHEYAGLEVAQQVTREFNKRLSSCYKIEKDPEASGLEFLELIESSSEPLSELRAKITSSANLFVHHVVINELRTGSYPQVKQVLSTCEA